MKRFYFFLLLAVLVPVAASATSRTVLSGKLITGQLRSEPLIATYTTAEGVYSTFSLDFGYVLVEIVSVDGDEVVYATVVDSSEGDSFVAVDDDIDLLYGDYYVRYTTTSGEVITSL